VVRFLQYAETRRELGRPPLDEGVLQRYLTECFGIGAIERAP